MIFILITFFVFNNFSAQAVFYLEGQNKIYLLEGTTVSLNVSYTTETPDTLKAVINADTDIVVNGVINTGSQTGVIEIDPSSINTLNYGTYRMVLSLSGNGTEQTINTALFYEQQIVSLTMNNSFIETLTNQTTELSASLNGGTGTIVEWLTDIDSQITFGKCYGTFTTIETTMSFPLANNYTVTLLSVNYFGQKLSTNVRVIVWNPVKGFTLTFSPSIAAVNADVTFKLLIDSQSRFPMGDIYFNHTYDDGHQENNIQLNSVQPSLSTTGYLFKHSYARQGNYSIKSFIFSSLSYQKVELVVYVWNQIVLPSAVKYIETYKSGLFQSGYISNTPFKYYLNYGNGDTKASDPDIINDNMPITTSEWDSSYNKEGVYLLQLEGWNPMYSKSCSYTLHVQNPVPDLQIFPNETSPISLFPAGEPGVDFYLGMRDPSSLPPTNMTCVFCFEHNDCLSNIDIDFKINTSYLVHHEYLNIGVKNISINCSNEVSFKVITSKIEILPRIEGFTVTNGYILKLTTDNPTSLLFQYSQGTMLSVLLRVHSFPEVLVYGEVQNSSKTGHVPISANDMSTITYGTYKATLELKSASGQMKQIILALFYEEPISGFTVTEETDRLLVHNPTYFNVSHQTGSNMEIELVINQTESVIVFCNQKIFQIDYSYLDPINYDVSAVSRNRISAMSTQNKNIVVVNKVLGFALDTTDNLIDSYSNANVMVLLDRIDRLPMNILTLTLDFGDGTNEQIAFSDTETNNALKQSGHNIAHHYIHQGNYTINGIMESPLSSQMLQLNIYVWDNITNVRLQSNTSARVGEVIQFSFVNALKSGFEYLIQYGDSGFNQSTPDILLGDYIDTVFRHSYAQPGVYKVTVTLWNPFFTVLHTYSIIIQYPVLGLELYPRPPIQYPIPDGAVTFEINMTSYQPQPTNVTCQFVYEDGIVFSNDSVNIKYTAPVQRIHKYTTSGLKQIEIICSNIVSNFTLTTEVDIKSVELTDFTFDYQHIVPMNMTPNATDIPVTVNFDIILFECVRFPPSVVFYWDFGDETDFVNTSDHSILHTFDLRSIYTLTVFIQNSTSKSNKSLDIKIGAVDFSVNTYLGGVRLTTITYTMTGLSVYGEYELNTGSGPIIRGKHTSQYGPVHLDKLYDYGKYQPQITAKDVDFTEILYFPKPIVIDYNVTVLRVDMPDSLQMPNPGKLNVTASLYGTTIPLPFMSCTYDMQDFINFTVVTLTQNITTDDPLIFTFNYLTLGEHDVTVNCSNYYDNYLYKTKVTVINKCFTIEGIFDRQYARPTTPMKVYTIVDFDLTSRMGVHCSNETVTFHWTVYRYYSDQQKEIFNYMGQDIGQENKGSFRFAKGKVPEGLYEVNLNVSLKSTWIPERTYLKFVQPSPKAFIEGGYQRTTKLSNELIILDALTNSYDVGIGLGGNENLNFSWSCNRITANDLDELAHKYELKTDFGTPCNMTEISRGKAKLVLEDVEGYIITVNVTLGTVSSGYTQLIMAVSGNAPDVYIRCKLNCNQKYAVTAKSIWEVVCDDCDGIPIYHWNLKQQMGIGSWENVRPIPSRTGVLQSNFEIRNDSLTQNSNYEITIEVQDENGIGHAKWQFLTNQIPYDGTCKATNHSVLGRPPLPKEVVQEDIPAGKAFSTKFAIYCWDWKDEGERSERNESLDSISDIPLMYEYVIVQYGKTSNNYDLSKETSIYKGGESSARDLRLPAGSPESDYIITLYVKIIDRYGDYAKVNWTLNVTSDDDYVPSNLEGANKLFNIYDLSYNTTKAGGNDVSVLRLISSTASMYSSLTLTNATSTSTGDNSDSQTEEDDNDVVRMIQEKTKEFVAEVVSLVPPNTTAKVLPADAQLVASTLDECMSNPIAITQDASEGVTNTTYELMLNIQNTSNADPYPMSELGAIEGATLDVIDVLSKNLKFLENVEIEDLNTTLTLELVETELREYLSYHPEETDKYPLTQKTFQEIYDKRKAIRDKQEETGSSTGRTSDKLFGAIDTVNSVNSHLVAYGEGEKVHEVDNMYLSIEKDSPEQFANKSTLERKGFIFEMTNETFTNVTTPNIDIQVSVLKKSPLIHAGGASKIRGKIVQFSAIGDNAEKIQLPLSMTVENEGTTYYSRFDTSIFNSEENGLMHFRLPLQDHNDAILVYILPDGFDATTTETYNLTLYATSSISHTVGEHEFKEDISPLTWTQYGFKTFIPSGTLKTGNIVLSLKAKEVPPNITDTGGLSRRKRSAGLSTATSHNQTFANISIAVVTTGCRTYNDKTASWTPNGCTVLPFSTINETVCRCEPGSGTLFASSFFVPNLIDFHSVWSKFDPGNAAVYGTLIAIFVLYIVGVVILRRYDKKDQIKWMPVLLCDNQKNGKYFYLISVYTGLRPGSGTKSNVSFILGGVKADTGIRLLSDGTSTEMESKTVKTFIMATPVSLGDLTYLRIWHDNSGEGDDASWYLHKIVVDDLHNKERYSFLCDRWLALDMDDGMIDRLCPVIEKENAGFETVFSQETRTNITDNHLWLSILLRPQRSLFTRVQRLSCVLSLLLLTMITNAMFFQSSDEETVTADTVRIGSLRLSLRALYISAVGIIITVPPIMMMTYLFKNTKAKKTIKKKTKHNNKEENKNGPLKNGKVQYSYQDEMATEQSKEIIMEGQARFEHWVVYIAWIVVILSTIVPAFFMLLYNMEWGKSKSEEWLTTFVLSFVESIFVVDPLKVLVIALVIAWVIKRPSEDSNYTIDLDTVREKCKQSTDDDENQFMSLRMEVLSKSGPPIENTLQAQRLQRVKEKIAQKAFIEVVLQILFAIIVFSISYVNRDERTFTLKNHLDQHLYESSKTQFGFSKVTTKEAFLTWITETFIPFTYPTKSYNDHPLGIQDTYYTADQNNVRVGLARLRQIRANQDNCIYSGITADHFCVPKYDTDNENKSTMIPKGAVTYTSNAWTYASASSIWGIPITGLYNTYSGGGFIQSLHNQKAYSNNIINELNSTKWIDRFTRAVFVEFSLFNPNVNLFSYSIYLAEFAETGAAFHWADTQCFRGSTITDATGVLSILFYIIFLIIIIVMSVKLINKFRQNGCKKTILNLWNILDLVLCGFSYTGTVVWIIKFVYTKIAMKKYYDNKNVFINFQHIVVWEYLFTCILAVLCFAATLRILSALAYNKKLTEVADVLRKGSKPIMQFAVVFMCVFFNFVGFGYLLFGSTLFEYRNLFIAFGSLTNTLIGRNSLDSMIRAAPNFAEIYFFVYVFFVIFTLMTMFAAILNESISESRSEKTDDTIGIIQIVKTAIKDVLGIAGIKMRNAKRPRSKKKYVVNPQQKKRQTIDTSNVLGLIRETLDDFEIKDEKDNKKNTAKDEVNTEMTRNDLMISKDDVQRPATAASVKLSVRDTCEVNDNENFYDFYKGYI